MTDSRDGRLLYTGTVKWFNLVKGFGFITSDDDGQDFFVHQTAIKSSGYRSLGEGEKVQFNIVESEKGKIASFVTSTDGGNVTGASRKSRVKKGARKYTSLCFNCNEGGHRVRNCPYERRNDRICHKCGSKNHLIRACPKLEELLKQLRSVSSDTDKDFAKRNEKLEQAQKSKVETVDIISV